MGRLCRVVRRDTGAICARRRRDVSDEIAAQSRSHDHAHQRVRLFDARKVHPRMTAGPACARDSTPYAAAQPLERALDGLTRAEQGGRRVGREPPVPWRVQRAVLFPAAVAAGRGARLGGASGLGLPTCARLRVVRVQCAPTPCAHPPRPRDPPSCRQPLRGGSRGTLHLPRVGGALSVWVLALAPPAPAQVQPLQGLPTVTINEFREYLAHMADLMHKFEAINPTGNSSLPEAACSTRPPPAYCAAGASDGDGATEDGGGSAHSGVAGSGGGGQRRAGLEVAEGKGDGAAGSGFSLDAVPAFYFERDFRLDDLITFERTGRHFPGFFISSETSASMICTRLSRLRTVGTSQLATGVGCRVSGFGCRVSGFGFRVSGFGFRVSGVRFRVSVSGLWRRVSGVGSMVSGVGFRVLGVRFRVSGVGSMVSGFGCRVSGVGFRVSGFGCRVSGVGLLTFERTGRHMEAGRSGGTLYPS